MADDWTDDKLKHMCFLSTIWADFILSKNFDVTDVVGDEHPKNIENCFKILAETFVELQSRQGLKPRFKVKALPPETADMTKPLTRGSG